MLIKELKAEGLNHTYAITVSKEDLADKLEAKIKEILLPPQDVWLSATEAKKLKICDKIEELY